MDEFKPEDELKPDPSDRRTGRSRQVSDRDNEPQINFDDVDLDADERRPTRGRQAREEAYDDADDEYGDDEDADRRPAKRKKALSAKPASRQYVMMAVGILVLLLLIVGIGSALKSPVTASNNDNSSEKSIDLSANNGANAGASTDQTNSAPSATEAAPAGQTDTGTAPSQDVSLPPIASTPTQGQTTATPEGQQRVEVQGDLNSALSQQQGQLDNVVANSTLPTEPATVAPLRNGTAPRQATTGTESQPRQPATAPRQERQHAVIEAKRQATAKAAEPKPVASQPKRTEPAATRAPVTAPTATASQPKAATSSAAPAASAGRATAGDVNALKSAPGNHYTLQLSSSSNYNNLNSWAKKENLKNYVVYQTTRNGQPWYVLVSGVYASKDDAKRAVSALPADVQAKNPWTKPLHQVQADLK